MVAVKFLYEKAKTEFDKAGIDDPAFNSMCLVEKVFGVDKNALISGTPTADDDKAVQFITLVGRRLSGEPLQYLLGQWEFYGYPLKVGSGVLIPRDDTEVLLRDCLKLLENKPKAKVLDLCSGSGALAIALAKERDVEITAVELSPKALPYLVRNIALNKAEVRVVRGDIFECTDEFEDDCFDLILSNPPYIKSGEIDDLQTEISFEPRLALDGGEDGYDFYRHIIRAWKSKLKDGGTLAFELGEGQYDAVAEMMKVEGFENIGGSLDLGGIQRSIYGTLHTK